MVSKLEFDSVKEIHTSVPKLSWNKSLLYNNYFSVTHYFFYLWDRMPNRHSFREEGLIWAPVFTLVYGSRKEQRTSLSPRWYQLVHKVLHMGKLQEAKKEKQKWRGVIFQMSHLPSSFQTKSYPMKAPQPSR